MPCRTSGPSAYPARTPRSSTRPATGRSSAVAPAGTVDRHLEQAQDAGGRRAAALVEVEDLGDLGQRPEQALGHEDQHGVEPDLEVAAERRPAAEQQRAGEADQDRHPDQRHERGRRPDRVGVGLGGRPAETAATRSRSRSSAVNALMVAMPEMLEESVLERSATAARTRSYSGSRRRWKTSDPITMSGIGRKAKTRSWPDAAAKTAPTSSTLSAVCRIAGAPTSRKRSSWLTSSLSVASVEPAGRLSCQPEVEVLDVVVRLHAQVVLDALRQAAPQDAGDVLAHRLDEPHHGVDHGQPAELGEPRLDAQQLADEGRVAAHHHVDGRADEQLGDDVGHLVDRRGRDGADEPGAVGPVAAPEGSQWLDGIGVGRARAPAQVR